MEIKQIRNFFIVGEGGVLEFKKMVKSRLKVLSHANLKTPKIRTSFEILIPDLLLLGDKTRFDNIEAGQNHILHINGYPGMET